MLLYLPVTYELPDPPYISLLSGKRVMFDVGTLLRSILFPESHSSKILKQIINSPHSIAIISPHIRNKALDVLKIDLPQRVQEFVSGLIDHIGKKVIEVVKDGDPQILPSNARYDSEDDDIVIATGISSGCDLLSTLDKEMATHASECIEILPPSDIDRSKMINFESQNALDKSRMYASPREGSIAIEFSLTGGAFGYYSRKKSRHHIFHTDKGFTLWVNDKNWKCQVGFIGFSTPIYTFEKINLENETIFSLSYDCDNSFLCLGLYQKEGNKDFQIWRTDHFEANEVGNQFRFGGPDMLPMHVFGILSTRKRVEEKSMKYSLAHRCHFEPLDCQRFPLTNLAIEQSSIVSREEYILRKLHIFRNRF